MNFMENFLPVFLGSFLGGSVSVGVAYWQNQTNKKINHGVFYRQYNFSKVYIDRFISETEEILELVEGGNRINAQSILFSKDFLDLKEYLISAIKETNPNVDENIKKDFKTNFMMLNFESPLDEYKKVNGLFMLMAIFYNGILHECRNLVTDLPSQTNMGLDRTRSLSKQLKYIKKRYKRINRALSI